MDIRERRILVNTCFGHFMSHFNMLAFPAVVIPLTGLLKMDIADVLAISFWMYLLFGITALPWGMVADRWKVQPLMLLFYLGSACSGLSAAMWINSPTGLTITLAALGFFSAIYHPTGLGLISKEISRVGLGMGYNGMFGSLGLAMAPLLTGIANWLWGPRIAYLLLGLLNVLGVVLMIVFPLTQQPRSKKPASGDKKSNKMITAFLILLVAMMLGGVAYRGASVILPVYLELKNPGIFQWLVSVIGGGLSKNLVATSIAGLIYFMGIPGQFTGGRIAERFEPKFCYLIFHATTIPVAFAMAIMLDLPLILLALIYFFFLLGMQPIENTLVARMTPESLHHSAFGIKFVLTFGVGALAVKMVESIQSNIGIHMVFPAIGLVSMAAVGTIGLLIWKTRNPVPKA